MFSLWTMQSNQSVWKENTQHRNTITVIRLGQLQRFIGMDKIREASLTIQNESIRN